MDDRIFLGKYRISAEEIQPAGELAGNSLAYQAEAIDSGKKAAVELVSTCSLKVAAIERLEAEAIAVKKLNHINISPLCDFGVEEDHLIYVTENFEGTLAEEWVNAYGPMPVSTVLHIASQVVSALSAAAFQQVVHHAINPGNLLLVTGQTAEGEWPLVKVMHFVGAAPKVSGTDTAVAAFDKSLHYVSPEQIKKGTVDFRSEIYSLGCTMWFLLTGAPPMTGKKGPMPLPPTKVAGKAIDIPKKVKRLLAQMLSPNPKARLRDPLEFYRKLRECLIQVKRRERISRRFEGPSVFRAPATGGPFFRKAPTKALALAAVLLAIATLAAFIVPRYTRHRRILRAQEPIGVPIGVPDAVAIATPAAPSAPSPIASNLPPEIGALAQSKSSPPEAAGSAEATNPKTLSAATDSLERAFENQVNKAPQSTTPDLSPNPQGQEPAPVIADNANGKSATSLSEAASVNRVANAPSPTHSRDATARKTAPKTIVLHEVRRAEPAEPEVRRAEPAAPGEGPGSRASVPSKATKDIAAQIEETRDAETNASDTTAGTGNRIDSESTTTARPRATGQRPAKPKRRLGEKIYVPEPIPEFAGPRPPSPGRSVRARFVGVTPDGRWMMQLPSNEIIIVPPPPARER